MICRSSTQLPEWGSAWCWLSYLLEWLLVKLQARSCGITMKPQRYQEQILERVIVSHFYDPPVGSRPTFVDDNTRSYRARAVRDYLKRNAIDALPRTKCSSDLSPMEYLWIILSCKMRTNVPSVQTLAELAPGPLERMEHFFPDANYKIRQHESLENVFVRIVPTVLTWTKSLRGSIYSSVMCF